MATNMAVRTQREAYNEGYQDALADIAVRLVEEGVDGVARWIVSNTADRARREGFLQAWSH